ncbi:MAG: hypothetical protein MUP45_01710 [Candidatus Marinimicrobia bacterium]|nr:hypothetical protein [Candidatus Neomarinimicrobiota bacterium]
MEPIIAGLVSYGSIGLVLGIWLVIILAAFSMLILWIWKLREEQKGNG